LRHSLQSSSSSTAKFRGDRVRYRGSRAGRWSGASGFDAILLDVGLPDMDGASYAAGCAALCQRADWMLTAADSEADTVMGLDAGANDYITKPFRLSVLLARLRAHLRQSEHSDDAVLRIGPYTFSPGQADGRRQRPQKVRLTEKETAILKYLFARRPVIGRDTLLGEVWANSRGHDAYPRNPCLTACGQKIERDPAHAEILVRTGRLPGLLP